MPKNIVKSKKVNNEYDESFTKEEIEYIENILEKTIKNNEFVSEEKLYKILLR